MLTGIADATTVDGEVDARLEDCVAAGGIVDSDPGRRRVPAGPVGRLLGIRNDEGPRHGLVDSLQTINNSGSATSSSFEADTRG